MVRADAVPGERRIIEVANMDGPSVAAERFVEEVGCGRCIVSVRERGQPSEWTMWAVEPVTTYRARPA